ncbi:SapC family protein [Aureimonas sp. AU40]|uniref:SapC family protein n=1 Tax=Aureimonas sp. AU40 TaxID=1637747 RepID=UPI00078245A5|nr:SapC family protein [Aureimonas sp. AU40]
MTGAVPLLAFASQRYSAPRAFRFALEAGFVAVNDTEYLLTAHHLPLVARIEGGEPVLGALVAEADLVRPAMEPDGAWRLGYLPIALRTYPFVLAEREAQRPIDEIDVLVPGAGLLGAQGAPISVDLATGQLGPEMMAIRNTLHMTRSGRARLSQALELLRIAGVLVPIVDEAGASRGDWTVDASAFAALGNPVVASLARQSFLPLDLAGAMLFSRRHLRPERLPKPEPRALGAPPPKAVAIASDPADFMLASLEEMDFALDGSDLFDLGDVVLGAEFAPLSPELEQEAAA